MKVAGEPPIARAEAAGHRLLKVSVERKSRALCKLMPMESLRYPKLLQGKETHIFGPTKIVRTWNISTEIEKSSRKIEAHQAQFSAQY